MKLPVNQPYLKPGTQRFTLGSNFASGGAGVLADTHPGTVSDTSILQPEKSIKPRKSHCILLVFSFPWQPNFPCLVSQISLPQQLSYFKNVVKQLKQKLGEVKTKKLLKRAVYLFSIGGNDYFSFFRNNGNASKSSQAEYVGIVIGNLTIVLQVCFFSFLSLSLVFWLDCWSQY